MRQLFPPRRVGPSERRWLVFAALCGLMAWLAPGELVRLSAQEPAGKAEAPAKEAAAPKDEPPAPAPAGDAAAAPANPDAAAAGQGARRPITC